MDNKNLNEPWIQDRMDNAYSKGFFNNGFPNKLYRYRPVKRALSEIEENFIYISNHTELNDPYELKMQSSLDDKEELYERLEEDDPEAIILKSQIEHIKNYNALTYKESKEKIGIICLSDTNESLPMWSHYSDRHRGICIEYDFYKIKERYIFKIVYSEKMFNYITDDLGSLNETMHQMITTKNKEWEYEKEWRWIFYNSDYIKKFDIKNCITGVYIGIYAEDKFKSEVIKLCREKNIKVYEMKVSSCEYKMMYKEIKESL